MTGKRLLMTGVLLHVVTVAHALRAAPLTVQSPNGDCRVTCDLKDIDGARGCPVYSVFWKGARILTESRLGLSIEGQAPLAENFAIDSTSTDAKDSRWKPVCGTKSEYPDRYKELTIHLRETAGARRRMDLTFRAYDEGVAFRYAIPTQEALGDFTLAGEDTEFRFTDDHFCWHTDYPQGIYDRRPVSKTARSCRPLLVEAGDTFVAIAEAGSLEHYVPMVLTGRGTNTVQTQFRKGVVSARAPVSTPWRVVMLADTPGTLVENHYLILNLNEPCALSDTSWIKPGKVWRNTAVTRENSDAIVNYNAAHNYQYVHWDTGWNGKEYDKILDHPTRILPGKDLLGAIRYAHEHGQGFILYVNHKELENYDLDETFRTYKQWGVDGVKYGFVNFETQEHMAWLHGAMRKAAEYRLMVNIHDNYRPTGYERTYPNLMTFEGIAGNETRGGHATPRNRLVLSFARPIAGAADFTPCYLDRRVESRAFQLACGVVFYSPWQYLHWYDRPASYEGAHLPELEYWERMPTVWDDSRVLHGRIGEYMTVARRRGVQWFVSSITDHERTLDIALAFLEPGRQYQAAIYREDDANRLHVTIDRQTVTARDTIHAAMGPGGGHNIWLHPLEDR